MEEGPAVDPDKYPGPRAASAAQRVHYYCGKWPHELLGSFEPVTWVERLSDEFATLIRLTVKSRKFELGDIIKRLKDLAREHPYDGAKYVNRQDISTVREWLRKEGIDALHYRRRSRNSPGEGDYEADDSIVIKSGSEDPVIIAETPFVSDDSDDVLSNFENDFDMGETEQDGEASNEHNQALTSQIHSSAATPARQNTRPVTRSVPSEPSTRAGNHQTPASQSLAQTVTTPSNRAQSPSDRFRANEVINGHFQGSLRRRTMASSVSRSGTSSQPQSASRAGRTHPNPSTPVVRLNNAARGGSLAAPSPTTPSRRANRSPNRRAAPEPHVRAETRQHTTSGRGEVRQSTNAESQPTNTESQYGPSTPRTDGQIAGNAIPTPTSTPATPVPSSSDPQSLMRLIEPRSTATTRSRQYIKVEDDSPPPTALPSYPDGPSGSRTNNSTHAHEAAPPSTSRDRGAFNASTPTRPVAQTSVGSASSSSIRPPNRPHCDTMPPTRTRHAHALPLSALVNRDVSRKRPMESDRPITHNTPQQPAASSPLRIIHATTTAPAEAPSSQTTPTNNSASRAMTSTQATPNNMSVMEPNPQLQPTTLRPNSFVSTGPPAWVNGEPSSQPAHTQVPQSSIAVPAQTSSPGTVENRPSKRLRSDDPRQPSTSSNEPFDFDATLPDGESFKRQLREWRSWAESHVVDINTKLENIQKEIRAMHQIMFTNNSNREITTKKMQDMQQTMQDNQAHITKTYKIIEVLEPESIGDESTREYLEKRKRQLAERERVQQSYQDEISQAQNLLREIEIQQPMIEKKLDEYVQDETNITKSKESLELAMRKCNFQLDFLGGQGGWTKAFESLEATNGRVGRLDARLNAFSAFNGEVRR
ncbi:hypothetical protein FVEN_g847 [Fusarium venenatum]|uniref:Uncharacterized protein n=1 Tax=Fusarium venenatum TaxID=56646 RepID=A0A2L2TZL1_9HYPO|nr:uncharacterized protein FVRRES_10743 [Fusarium venenatum]KAG8361132.1 hypothetical protein FVEN_g847 [Fusarium venenatum]CEI70666.1 unnamed protein product [Fusarium venenatum]